MTTTIKSGDTLTFKAVIDKSTIEDGKYKDRVFKENNFALIIDNGDVLTVLRGEYAGNDSDSLELIVPETGLAGRDGVVSGKYTFTTAGRYTVKIGYVDINGTEIDVSAKDDDSETDDMQRDKVVESIKDDRLITLVDTTVTVIDGVTEVVLSDKINEELLAEAGVE